MRGKSTRVVKKERRHIEIRKGAIGLHFLNSCAELRIIHLQKPRYICRE